VEAPPILIVRRPRRHKAHHHGGAWKVAYADFVTAMMALFIVLWLLSSSEQVQKAVGGYFSDPTGHGKEVGNGLRGVGGESLTVRKEDMSTLKNKLEAAVQLTAPQKINEHVTMAVTGEGLRVELSEGERGDFFFESGSPLPTDFGKEILATLAAEVGKMPNRVIIEGHTDSKPFGARRDYSNWELSVDRANAARRLMEAAGMRPDQVVQVRGFADQKPREHASSNDASNRRITVIVENQAATESGSQASAAKGR